jgi:hypothetical protein
LVALLTVLSLVVVLSCSGCVGVVIGVCIVGGGDCVTDGVVVGVGIVAIVLVTWW